MVILRVKVSRNYTVRDKIIRAVESATDHGTVQAGMRQGLYVLITVRDRDNVDLDALRKAGFKAEVL